MQPGQLALVLYQGATFRRRFIWKARADDGSLVPVDLTGWEAKSDMRVDGHVALAFDSLAGDGSLTLGGVDGSLELLAPDTDTATARVGSGWWSLVVTAPGGDRDVLLTGPVTIVEGVTP